MAAASVRAQPLPRRLARDPGLASLRVAARAALTQPLVLAFGLLVLRNAQLTLFMVFGVFALLVLASFGGPARNRLLAYVATTLLGGALVAVGGVASASPWTAALVALVAAFCIEFAGLYRGNAAVAQFPLLMSVVLGASIPAPPSAIPSEVEGWLLGGFIATASALLLWPRYEHAVINEAASAAMRSLAALVAATRAGTDATERHQSAAEAVAEFRTVYRQTAYRPAGPTRRDRALAQLVTELEQAMSFAAASVGEPDTVNPGLPEGDQLAAAVVSVLQAGARVLQRGPVPDLDGLERARIAHRTALDAWAGKQLRTGASSESVLDGLDHDHRLRMLAYHVVAIGADAAIVAGHDFERGSASIPFGTPIEGGLRPLLGRFVQTLSSHMSWSSPIVHTSIRVAVGLALGVLLARLLGLQHAFWVVLGTLSVLRSNALATGRTTVQAMAGTLLGFAVGGLFALFFGHVPLALWAALPVAVFLAAYAPSAVSFVAGQAAFTVLLLILFNLLAPVGWQVGVVRIEDVALGSAIGLAAGILLWPRGARSDFARTLSQLYRVVAVHLAEAIALVLGHGQVETLSQTRSQVWQARDRAGESFDQLVGEHSSRQLEPETAGFMLASAEHALTVADSMQVAFDMGYTASECVGGVDSLDNGAAALVASWFMLAERIEGVAAVRTVPLHREELRQAALDCLAASKGASSQRGQAAIAVAWTREWIEHLGVLVQDLDAPAGSVAASAAVPWWSKAGVCQPHFGRHHVRGRFDDVGAPKAWAIE